MSAEVKNGTCEITINNINARVSLFIILKYINLFIRVAHYKSLSGIKSFRGKEAKIVISLLYFTQ